MLARLPGYFLIISTQIFTCSGGATQCPAIDGCYPKDSGYSCSVDCPSGYYRQHSTNQCNGTTWSHAQVCVRQTCVATGGCGLTNAGSACSFYCSTSSGNLSFQCGNAHQNQQNGIWATTPTSCPSVSCNTITGCAGVANGDTCNVHCPNGYYRQHSQNTCHGTTWSHAQVCVRQTCVATGGCGVHDAGSVCSSYCSGNFHCNGSTNQTQTNGIWAPTPTSCANLSCGAIIGCAGSNGVCNVQCPSGYYRRHSQTTCQGNTWSHTQVCVRQTCVATGNCGPTDAGNTCVVNCGYLSSGSQVFQCQNAGQNQQNGIWANTPTSCFSGGSCGAIIGCAGQLANGVCNVDCPSGYYRQHSQNTCNGTWSHAEVCVRQTCVATGGCPETYSGTNCSRICGSQSATQHFYCNHAEQSKPNGSWASTPYCAPAGNSSCSASNSVCGQHRAHGQYCAVPANFCGLGRYPAVQHVQCLNGAWHPAQVLCNPDWVPHVPHVPHPSVSQCLSNNGSHCIFPFFWHGKWHTTCESFFFGAPWCSTKVYLEDGFHNGTWHVKGEHVASGLQPLHWGNCPNNWHSNPNCNSYGSQPRTENDHGTTLRGLGSS